MMVAVVVVGEMAAGFVDVLQFVAVVVVDVVDVDAVDAAVDTVVVDVDVDFDVAGKV